MEFMAHLQRSHRTSPPFSTNTSSMRPTIRPEWPNQVLQRTRFSVTAPVFRRLFLASPVNECLELHDSTLSHVTFRDGSAVVSLSSAYVHRSPGRPGRDAGSGGYQPATLTFG